jgi:hypothetical protein
MRMTAEDVDVEEPLGLGDGAFLGGTGGTGTRIVDQDVQAPEPLDHLLDHGGDRLVTGHVEIKERHPVGRGDSRGVAAGSDHLEARVGERERGGLADARGRTCHQRHRPSCCHPELLDHWIMIVLP